MLQLFINVNNYLLYGISLISKTEIEKFLNIKY